MESSEKRPVKRIAILGANGQIGQVITVYLQKQYPQVQLLACVRSSKANRQSHPGVNYVYFDPFADNWKVLGKVDVLINCIGIIRETKDMSFEKAHSGLTQLLLVHRELMGNPRIIQISALGADASHQHPFLQTKGRADTLLLQQQNTIVIRPSIVCTPNTVFLQKLKMLKSISKTLLHTLPFPDQVLKTRIQPVMAEDVAAIVAKLCISANYPRTIYAVGPVAFSLKEFIKLAAPETRILTIPEPLFNFIFRITSPLFSHLINPAQYELLTCDNTADCSISEDLLGRQMYSTTDFWIKELSEGK